MGPTSIRDFLALEIHKTLIIIFALTVITLALQTNPAKSQIVTDGLVSYWTFDSADIKDKTVKDVWGDNDGTIIAITLYITAGR